LNEISVLVDIRVSPDSPDLVLVRRQLAIVNGELQLIGEPVESSLSLHVPRIVATARWSGNSQVGPAIIVSVRNTGFTPVEMISVMFVWQGPADAQNATANGHEQALISSELQLLPRDRKQVGMLLPGKAQEWYLPFSYEAAVRVSLSLPPTGYKIVVLVGNEQVAEVPGEQLQPLFDRFGDGPQPRMGDQLRSVVASLPPTIQERLTESLRALSATPVEVWSQLPNLNKLENSLYLLGVPPDYRVLFRRHRRGGIELIDVARTANQQVVAANG